jgi:protein SCO1/2
LVAAGFGLAATLVSVGGRADDDLRPSSLPADFVPPELQNVGVTEHIGDRLPMDTKLHDEAGHDVALGDFFKTGKPVALAFVYHTCPMLCSMVQSAFSTTIRDLSWSIGQDYEVLTISIDPRDTPAIASEKKDHWVQAYGRDAARTARGWHFLTGDEAQIKRLTSAAGFSYYFDPRQKQYAHSAAVFVLTPEGKLARYLYGIEFPAQDLRFALTEAAEGRSGSTIDHLMLFCYQYDPNARGYVLAAWRIMRAGAALTVLLLGSLLGRLWFKERRRPHDELPPGDDGPQSKPPAPRDLQPKLEG